MFDLGIVSVKLAQNIRIPGSASKKTNKNKTNN